MRKKLNITKDFLYKEYIINKKSSRQIGKELECSHRTILNYLKKYNIPIRTISEANKGLIPFSKGKHLSFKHRKNIGKVIKGRKLSISWRRKISLNHANVKGKNNPFYGKKHSKKSLRKQSLSHGGTGISHENNLYSNKFSDILKTSIRERDNHQCQICGKLQSKFKGFFKKLDVHHIDYDKNNLDPLNLISLCHKCHMQTNGNRDIYQEYFKILKEILIS